MPADQQTFLERWFLGPHEPEERSIVGRAALNLVESRFWERIFLLYILFNVCLKLTWQRNQTCEYDAFLTETGLFACIIFTAEWLIEMLSLG
jgi:O-antigen ligase